jgi:glycosyltransferase involved in cell wall biosynthesis/Tfp pilus assembly protein PilF
MRTTNYLIVHKDHPFNRNGVNSGAENATRSLARALVAQGHRVTIAAQLTDPAPQGPTTDAHGVEWFDLGPGFTTDRALAYVRARGEYCLISAGRAQPLFESRSDPRCILRILISHDRSGNDTGIRPTVLCEVVDRVVCVSEAQREIFLKAGVPPSKVVTLYNGVDLEMFPVGRPEQRDFRKLVFVGALVEDKGVHWLIESFCALKAKYPDLTLDIYGSSDLWGRKKLFDEADIARRVPGLTFHGKVSQERVGLAMSRAGICVIPSIWFDPFPLTALEAQATGCPVVTFDVGGLKEGVRDGETAVVVREVTPQALTSALDSLLQDPRTLRLFSEQAIERCRPRFTWERVASDLHALNEEIQSSRPSPVRDGKIGVVTTWNQPCGLATYAQYLFSELPEGSVQVFSEVVASPPPQDSMPVLRCWRRGERELKELENAILASGVALVHCNVHPEFFAEGALAGFLKRLRASGVKSIVHLHNTFSLQASLAALAEAVDRIIVHGEENRLQLVANGIDADRVVVMPHGVRKLPPLTQEQRYRARATRGIPEKAFLITAFGFVQPHKGMEGVIEGVLHLRAQGIDAHGCIVGQVMDADPGSRPYAAELKRLIAAHGLQQVIRFTDAFVPADEVTQYLQLSDVVLMNYRSAHYEASGACATAVGAGALVVTSLAPPFQCFGDAVWHLTSGFPLTWSLDLIAKNQKLRTYLGARANEYATTHAWPCIAASLRDLYREMGVRPTAHLSAEGTAGSPKPSAPQRISETHGENAMIPTSNLRPDSQRLSILFQNRPNALTQPGGDTIVMQRTAEELRALGHEVVIDCASSARIEEFDLVHLFNFALPEVLRQQAERCAQANVPFVVTTLCEDVPTFHRQSWEAGRILMEYIQRGQNATWLASEWPRLAQVQPSGRFDNTWVASRAAALIANGEGEKRVLLRDYPNASAVRVVPVGFDSVSGDDPSLFESTYGLKDFVLCVGRLETRKNQLMLLKALEESNLPVVLVGGGVNYQPEYAAAVRAFRRSGQTLVLGRLAPEMLSSAYAACRVHALVSHYELPGLVSLEAAAHGKNVVVTDTGTTGDYFGDNAFYANPLDWRSIRTAVLAGYYAPVPAGLRELANQYRWSRAAKETVLVYQKALDGRQRVRRSAEVHSAEANKASKGAPSNPPSSVSSVTHLIEEGEAAAREGDFSRALERLEAAREAAPQLARIYRSLGAVLLAQQERTRALANFTQALRLDPREVKAMIGLGMCAVQAGQTAAATQYFREALRIEPTQTTALHQMVQLAHQLGEFSDLEQALRVYVQAVPNDREFAFCLAGCLFKQGKATEAEEIARRILTAEPQHRGALDLVKEIELQRATAPQPRREEQRTTLVATDDAAIPVESSWLSKAAQTPLAVAIANTAVSAVPTPPQPAVASSAKGVEDVPALFARIDELKREGNAGEAAELCAQLLERGLTGPDLERARCLRAELHSLEGEVEPAQRLYDVVLKGNPQSARAWAGRGALAAFGGNWDEAENLFQKAQMIAPSYDVACAGLGLCAAQRGDSQQAWHWYWSATQSNPECMRALLGLIELAYPLGRLAELEQALRQYLELHPADLQFMYSLAGCLYAQNRVPEAKGEVEKIIIFEPTHERANELKGLIEKRTGPDGSPWGAPH